MKPAKPGRLERRIQILRSRGINLVLDIGANRGQYATRMRASKYLDRIVSFEPGAEAFRELQKLSAGDPLWQSVQLALGDANGTAPFYVSRENACSSLMKVLPLSVEADARSEAISMDTVSVQRLDSIFDQFAAEGDRVFVKIDAQGFGQRILDGAAQCLERIAGFQIEMELVPLYEGEVLFEEMLPWFGRHGFSLFAVEPGFSHPTSGRLLSMDGIFCRE